MEKEKIKMVELLIASDKIDVNIFSIFNIEFNEINHYIFLIIFII